jgi:hypothetical protein
MGDDRGVAGCATFFVNAQINAVGPGLPPISDDDNVVTIIKNLRNYYFIKGFYGDYGRGQYPIEKNNNVELFRNFDERNRIPGRPPSEEIREFHRYLFSMYSIDILPSINYSIRNGIIQCVGGQGLAISNGDPTFPARGSICAIVMRKLGQPFSKWDWDWQNPNPPPDIGIPDAVGLQPPNVNPEYNLNNRYSVTTYLNFVKKLSFFNTVRVHDDLHWGNFVFDIDAKEFNIIDMGITVRMSGANEIPDYRDDFHKYSIHQIREQSRNGMQPAARFNECLNDMLPFFDATPRYYWRTRRVYNGLRDGRTYFDNWPNTIAFYNNMWIDAGGGGWGWGGGGGVQVGELRALYNVNRNVFYVITNSVTDIFAASRFILYKTTFWCCPRIIKFFSVLFTHPNPFLRPLLSHIERILKNVLKSPMDTVKFSKDGQTMFEIESQIGVSKSFNIDGTNYNHQYNYRHNLSLWNTPDTYYNYFMTMNYYYLCYMINENFDRIMDRRTFQLDPQTLLARPMFSRHHNSALVMYQDIERRALIKLRNEIHNVEPLIVKDEADLGRQLLDLGAFLPAGPPAGFLNCP